jgi:hypothetical protein
MNPQREKQHRQGVRLILGAIVVAAILVAMYMFTLGRPVLVGDDFHDFGALIVRGSRAPGIGEHTFKLTNRTSRPLQINAITTSCGCAITESNTDVVQPGEALELDVKLIVRDNGLSVQTVSIQIENRGVQTLTVRGTGRRAQQLRSSRRLIQLVPDEPVTMSMFMDVWPDDLPSADAVPELVFEGSDGLEVTMLGWSRQREYDDRRGMPAIWTGQLRVQTSQDSLPEDAELVVRTEPQQVVRVPVEVIERKDEPPQPMSPLTDDAVPFNPLEFQPGSDPE